MAEITDQEFVESVVKAIVESPAKVSTVRTVDERGVLIELTVDPADMGKIIGKEGKTAKSIRTLLRVFGAKSNARVNLKIVEPEGSERPPRRKYDDNKEESKPVEANKDESATDNDDEKKDEVVLDDDIPTDVLA